MIAFWKNLQGHLKRGQRVFVSLVAENTKGSPGTPGAKFLVSAGGDLFGTIGGGNMEYRLIDHARMFLGEAEYTPEKRTLVHRKTGSGEKSGMICSGSQTNIYCLCEGERDLATVERIVAILQDDRPGWLGIDTGGMRVEEKGPNFDRARITLVEENGKWTYGEDLLNRRRLALIGGGHCSVALCEVMARLGYEVLIFDKRKDVFTLKKATDARRISIVADYAEAGPMISFPKLTAVVVMTTDFLSDVRGLLGVVNLPFPFIGLMGSNAKIVNIYTELRKAGVPPEKLASIYGPVGLPIDSDTPEEIAISVAAQILQERNFPGKFR